MAATLEDLTGSSAAEATVIDSPRPVRRPLSAPIDDALSHVGRYVVLRKLGEGAMGEVHVAYDEQLDRKVAIKLVRAMGQRSDDVYARMLREAQGLARLSHPNVVQVYEAGEHRGQVYLAMEYIEGETLRSWASAGGRTWQQILERAIEAGRGLAAAHKAGLVHRDFKPDNAIVGADGRVRVLDFGLVRAEHETAADDEVLTGSRPGLATSIHTTGSTSLSSLLTAAHTLIGTPAYMSPEQHLREVADARSDIFAFCIVLYELLYGVRPFTGADQAAIMKAVLEQRLSEPSDGRRVPGWVRRVILRGLQVDPGARWQTMDALIAALEDDPARRWRRWGLVAAFVATIGAVVGGLGWVAGADARACSGGAEAFDGAWNGERRAALSAAFARSGVSYADDVATRVVERLDTYRQRWIASHGEACLAHRRGEHSGELLDLQMGCLRERRREVVALVNTLLDADAAVIERAVAAVSELSDPRICDDVEGLRSGGRGSVDPAIAERLEEARGVVAEAQALERAGRYDEGLTRLAALSDEVEAIASPALVVEVDHERGRLLLAQGAYEAADKALKRAYYEARGIGHDEVAAGATIDLLRLVSLTQASASEAERWTRQADAETRHLGKELALADFHVARAALFMSHGEFEAALADSTQALELRRKNLEPDHPQIAEALRGIGAAHFKRGRNAEARAVMEEALAITERTLGAGHPKIADILSNLALLAARDGRFDDGIAAAERALVIREATLGPTHPENANILSNLGELEILRGHYEAANRHLERAVAIAEAGLGADNPKVMLFVGSLAVARYKLGRLDEAQALMEKVVAIAEASFGPDHPNTAIFRGNLGEVQNDRGRFAEARTNIEAALATMRVALGPERPELGPVQRELARALLGLGEDEAALVEARAALELCERGGNITADELAKTRLVLARALRAVGDPEGEARGLAEAARRDLIGHEARQAALLEEIDAFSGRG
ncbi:MAG: tetratricopeptide repeat protein [Myxococcales bacterium]|nr:tetratricopeptide repeat protein [Myxococcales bacterium]